MTLHFAGSELSRLDALADCEALVLSFFGDERPLRGVAGLCDWRLCGRLSRLLKGGRISGLRGEVTMMPPPGGRLPFGRLMLFGLGESDYPAPFGEAEYRAAVRGMRDVVVRAGVKRYAVYPPGRATGLIAARRALELWLEVAGPAAQEEEVTIIESASGQKEMAEALRARR
jgi:cytosol aminopeptidase family protein